MADLAVHWMNRSWDYISNGPDKKDGPTETEHKNFIKERNSGFVKRSTPAQTFSLGGAIVFGLGWLFSLKSDNSLAKWTTGILAAVGLGATTLFKGWNKDGNDSILSSIKKFFSGETHDKNYENKIAEIAAKHISKHTGGNEEEIKKALLSPDSQNSDLLKDVLLIQYIVKKKDSSKAETEIQTWFEPIEGKVKKASTIAECFWDELPSKIRSNLKGGDTQTVICYRSSDNQKA